MIILNFYMLLGHTQPNNTRGMTRHAFSFLFIFLPPFLKWTGTKIPKIAILSISKMDSKNYLVRITNLNLQ